ncbi:hypothetical protein [Chryseobacterium sp. M5A1_1a]
MKHLELNLNKRLLIVEIGAVELAASMLIDDFFPEYELNLICKGSDLTEDIAKGLVNSPDDFQFLDAESTFIGEIEKHSHYWGNNPLQSTEPISDLSFYDSEEDYNTALNNWQEAETRTLNPAKTLIFEII